MDRWIRGRTSSALVAQGEVWSRALPLTHCSRLPSKSGYEVPFFWKHCDCPRNSTDFFERRLVRAVRRLDDRTKSLVPSWPERRLWNVSCFLCAVKGRCVNSASLPGYRAQNSAETRDRSLRESNKVEQVKESTVGSGWGGWRRRRTSWKDRSRVLRRPGIRAPSR